MMPPLLPTLRSTVLDGDMTPQDSMGSKAVTKAGDVQHI